MKRTGCIALLFFVFMVALGAHMNVAASETNAAEEQVLTAGIYEGDQLQAVAEILGYEMVTEDGYVLESISVTIQTAETEISTDMFESRAIGDHIGDVQKVSSDVYFPDNPIASNWYDGPLTKLSKTYSRTVSATYNCSVEVSAEVLNAGLSFDVTGSTTESTTWERPAITSSQKINVKEYGVYDKYAFTLYNIWGNQKGTGNAYKPMGLYVTQATYSK